MARRYQPPRARPPQPRHAPPPGRHTLRGSLLRLTFQNPENGFTIARFRSEAPGGGLEAGEEVVVTGMLEGVFEGEHLELSGQWTDNPRFGQQFAVEAYRQVPPASAEGIEAFLGSQLIRGIGKVYARRIVQAFGEDTLEVIDRQPERLKEIEGIGPKKYAAILEGWQEHRAIADIMSFLQSHGISATWASRIYRRYGDGAVRILDENPYRLALDMRGIGFRGADRIALKKGLAQDSPERAQAAALHLLREAAGKGHCFLEFDDLREDSIELLGLGDEAHIRQAVAALCRKDATPTGPHCIAEKLPAGQKAVYLAGLHHAECSVAESIARLTQTGKPLPRIDPDQALADYARSGGLELSGQQREAVARALAGGVTVMTGGPGTGKTTTVRALIHCLTRAGVRPLLAAPTGRAAKRLAETTRRDAATIHRLLKWDPKKGRFAYGEDHPLPTDYLIVDESSMLDLALANQLLKALAASTSLLLVGDVDQLPSVGPGNVLRDLIASGAAQVVALDTIFRQARRSLIVRNAHRINAGEMPMLAPPEDQDQAGPPPDFFFVERREPEQALQTILELVAERIPARHRFDPIEDIQVLTPMRRGPLGATRLNEALQERLNPDPRTLTRGKLTLKVGDKVMQLENDYDKDVFNGDIGRVDNIDRADHTVLVRFERRKVPYKYTELDALGLSYAVTIHKSQGSEYPCVVLPVHTQHYIMLQRNLLYTGLTRGRRLVVIVGTRQAVALATRNADQGRRNSGLTERIRAHTACNS